MWIVEKVIRLIPLYYLVLAVYLNIDGVGGKYWLGSHDRVSVLNIVFHFLFLHGFNPFYSLI